MGLELTVRGKTYKVDVDSKGNFNTRLSDEDAGVHSRTLSSETLKGLEQKLITSTRARSSKVALKFKRLGRQFEARGHHYGRTDHGPWEVIEVTVRGVNEHTGQLMVTWPDGTKSDDSKVGRYSSNGRIYFPVEMKDEEILRRRNLIDENEKWFETNALDVVSRAKKAVAEALGE
jgi:hypothetical protein